MSLFMPTVFIDGVTDINMNLLNKLSIKAILLDVDNTLALPGCQDPFDGVKEWLTYLNIHNIKIVIISNNFKKRVKPFAQQLKLPFISFACKPLFLGFLSGKKLLKTKKNNILVVGDQIFTDILGANLLGMKSVLLVPKPEKQTIGTIIKRKFENKIRSKRTFYKNGENYFEK